MKDNVKHILTFLIALLIIWACYLIYDWIGDQREISIRAEYTETQRVQDVLTKAKEAKLQKEVNDANNQYIEAMQNTTAANQRIDELNKRMRNNQPNFSTSGNQYTSATCGSYADAISRDYEECRTRYTNMGTEAAKASDAAWALQQAWPDFDKAVIEFNQLKEKAK